MRKIVIFTIMGHVSFDMINFFFNFQKNHNIVKLLYNWVIETYRICSFSNTSISGKKNKTKIENFFWSINILGGIKYKCMKHLYTL